jgi:predicted DNA-binding transcriptional regulator YafY
MLRIHQALQSGRLPNASTLSRELEVSIKTIHRDLEFMRDRLDLPIEYDSHRHGLLYTEEVKSFPTVQITEGELLALVIAEKAFQQYRGTHFERPLLSAIRKISESLPETISLSLSDVQQTISFRTRAEPIQDLQIFDELAKATADRRQLQLTYRKPGKTEAEERLVDPYHLANINGEWYLFAFDHLRKDMRTFVPSRIKEIKLTGKSFKRPQKFSLDRRLRGSFGVHSGQGEYEVVIRFCARAADYIREKRWHDSQELHERSAGCLDLHLKLTSLKEVERWVLSWGGEAVALSPRELAESVRAAAKRLLESTTPKSAQP